MDERIKELTLLLLYLTSWEEEELPAGMRRSWKGYPFDLLDKLMASDMIRGSTRSKSVYITNDGVKEAKFLLEKYLQNAEKEK